MRAGLSVSVSAGLAGGRVIGRADTERETCERAGGCVMRRHKNEREREQKHRLVHIIYKGSKVGGSCSLPLGQGGLVPLIGAGLDDALQQGQRFLRRVVDSLLRPRIDHVDVCPYVPWQLSSVRWQVALERRHSAL